MKDLALIVRKKSGVVFITPVNSAVRGCELRKRKIVQVRTCVLYRVGVDEQNGRRRAALLKKLTAWIGYSSLVS
jgi:hypothetical protein